MGHFSTVFLGVFLPPFAAPRAVGVFNLELLFGDELGEGKERREEECRENEERVKSKLRDLCRVE